MLGVAPKTIYNQLSAGRCPLQTIKFGRRRMVLLEGIRALAVRPFPEAPQRLSPHAENSN